MTPEQATTLAALQAQHRELATVIGRLEAAKARLVHAPLPSWRGPARFAHDLALDAVAARVDAATEATRSAWRRTGSAISGMHLG